MALSKTQNELLEKCQIPKEIQQSLEKKLSNLNPVPGNMPDFLLLLSDELRAAENTLHQERLSLSVLHADLYAMSDEEPPTVSNMEETIKNTWATATALWRAVDQVISNPATYNITLTTHYVQYALHTHNLPVVELLKWAKPEFFAFKTPPLFLQYIAAGLGSIGAGIVGLFTGLIGGIKQQFEKMQGLKDITLILMAPLGMLSGSAVGFMTGAMLGFRTGNALVAFKIGVLAAYLNPFYDPRGTKNYQAVQLKIEEVLFDLAQQSRDSLQQKV